MSVRPKQSSFPTSMATTDERHPSMTYDPQPLADIRAIVEQCQSDSRRWFPDTADDLGFNVLALAGEVGELANLVKKVLRGSVDPSEVYEDMETEAADVFIYICNV